MTDEIENLTKKKILTLVYIRNLMQEKEEIIQKIAQEQSSFFLWTPFKRIKVRNLLLEYDILDYKIKSSDKFLLEIDEKLDRLQ